MPGSAGGPLCLQFRELGHIGFTAHIVTYLTVANFCERYGCTSIRTMAGSCYGTWGDFFDTSPQAPCLASNATVVALNDKDSRLVEYTHGNLRTTYYGPDRLMEASVYDEPWHASMRILGHSLMSKYARPLPSVRQHVDELWRGWFGPECDPESGSCHVLGLHMRCHDVLTAQHHTQRRLVHPRSFRRYVEAYMETFPSARIFLATDEPAWAMEVRSWPAVQGRVYMRSNTAINVHHALSGTCQGDPVSKGLALVADVMHLARCSFLIHSASSVAEFATWLNPRLHHDSLHMGFPYGHADSWLARKVLGSRTSGALYPLNETDSPASMQPLVGEISSEQSIDELMGRIRKASARGIAAGEAKVHLRPPGGPGGGAGGGKGVGHGGKGAGQHKPTGAGSHSAVRS